MPPRTTMLLSLLAASLVAGCTGSLLGASTEVADRAGGADTCQKTTPRFAGEPVSIEAWAFVATDEIRMEVQATTQTVTLEHVLLDTDDDGAFDATFPARGAYGTELSPGTSEVVTLPVDGFASGDCAAVDMGLNVTVSGLGTHTVARGTGMLQGSVP